MESSSFRWTAGTLAGKNSKMPIYILAEDEIDIVFIKINFHVKLYTRDINFNFSNNTIQ